MKWSSTTLAKWYVGNPSDFIRIYAPSQLALVLTKNNKDNILYFLMHSLCLAMQSTYLLLILIFL